MLVLVTMLLKLPAWRETESSERFDLPKLTTVPVVPLSILLVRTDGFVPKPRPPTTPRREPRALESYLASPSI